MFNNLKDLSKINQNDIENERIDKIKKLNEIVFDEWNDFIKSYRKIEKHLEKNNILVMIETNVNLSPKY